MKINTVKIQANGYLVDGILSVPKVEGNRDYEAVKKWISEGNTPETEFTPEELEIKAADDAKAKTKRDGEDYQGYQIPFMNDDALALIQVKNAFDLGITSTNIEFTNGTIMPITATDFSEFALWFATKRNEFFL